MPATFAFGTGRSPSWQEDTGPHLRHLTSTDFLSKESLASQLRATPLMLPTQVQNFRCDPRCFDAAVQRLSSTFLRRCRRLQGGLRLHLFANSVHPGP